MGRSGNEAGENRDNSGSFLGVQRSWAVSDQKPLVFRMGNTPSSHGDRRIGLDMFRKGDVSGDVSWWISVQARSLARWSDVVIEPTKIARYPPVKSFSY